jgi:outer membrane protein assembly factor BamD (BamD/ComL family)
MLLDPAQVLHRQAQLDIANHAMQAGHHRSATGAYEQFLATYPRDPYADEVRLILGLAFLRYLHENEKARTYLAQAVEKLDDPGRRALAQQLLTEAGA